MIDHVGPVTTIGINRPQKRNCIDRETAALLHKAIENFESNDNSLVGVLYGNGGNFCSGYDLDEVANCSDPESLLSTFGAMVKIIGFHSLVIIYFNFAFVRAQHCDILRNQW